MTTFHKMKINRYGTSLSRATDGYYRHFTLWPDGSGGASWVHLIFQTNPTSIGEEIVDEEDVVRLYLHDDKYDEVYHLLQTEKPLWIRWITSEGVDPNPSAGIFYWKADVMKFWLYAPSDPWGTGEPVGEGHHDMSG